MCRAAGDAGSDRLGNLSHDAIPRPVCNPGENLAQHCLSLWIGRRLRSVHSWWSPIMLPTTDSTPAGSPSGIIFRALIAFGALLTGSAAGAAEPARPIDFNREIRPILSNHCFRCHGPDARKRKGLGKPLRLDTEEGAFGDLGGMPPIVRGNPEESELIRRIESDDADEVMPPRSTGKTLVGDGGRAAPRVGPPGGLVCPALGVRQAPVRPRAARGEGPGMAEERDRSLHPGPPRAGGAHALARGRPVRPGPPRLAST